MASLLFRSSPRLMHDLHVCQSMRATPVSLKQMYTFGQIQPRDRAVLLAAQFLHAEIPVRLSHLYRQLQMLPSGLTESPQVQEASDWYLQSFRDFRAQMFPHSISDARALSRLCKSVLQRHDPISLYLAQAIHDLRSRTTQESDVLADVSSAVEGFFMNRISVRMLLEQQVAMDEPPQDGFVGIIEKECKPWEVAQAAIIDAQDLCRRHYGDAPQVKLKGMRDLSFAYIPTHLHYLLFELLKNSLRAVVEQPDWQGNENQPAKGVRVIISKGKEDVCIKISDEGGGISRSALQLIWSFTYTTADLKKTSNAEEPDLLDTHRLPGGASLLATPLAGLGFGLPLARLYARYFGGDLQLISMEGYGCDSYVFLERLGEAEEALPAVDVTEPPMSTEVLEEVATAEAQRAQGEQHNPLRSLKDEAQ